MGKQLVSFITCGCESSAPFFVIYKAGREPTPSSDSFHMLIKILAQTFYPIALFEFQIEKVRRR
jgi:hypothetical protein